MEDIMYNLVSYYKDLEMARQSGAKVTILGKSTLGRDIHLLTKGDEDNIKVLVHAGIHAREYITTPLVIRLLCEYNEDIGIAVIPLVNIDGMLLVNEGLSSINDASRREFLLKVNNGSYDFRLWKANANAVDLNVNFNANWGYGKYNIKYPSSANYIGEYPMSERENQLLTGITCKLQPKITLSYHTKGNVIYHGYNGNFPHIGIARQIAKYINYDLLASNDSFGGYKDWFVATTPYLGLTIECGDDSLEHPIGLDMLDSLYNRQKGLFRYVAKNANSIE